MGSMTFEQVMRAADALSQDEQTALIHYLQAKSLTQNSGITRAQLLSELERRKASGVFEKAESLRGRFAHPANNLDFDEIQGILKDSTTEWESELDEFDSED